MIPSAPKWKRLTWTNRNFIVKETGSAAVQATGGHAGTDLCFHRKQARVKAADFSGLAIIRAPGNRALMSSA